MDWTNDEWHKQFKELQEHYGSFAILPTAKSNSISLAGWIHVYGEVKGYICNSDYHIRIDIPLNCSDLPAAYELDGKVERSYEHVNPKDGSLCIGTKIDIWSAFRKGFILWKWIEEFVVPFFATYEYFDRFECYPYGDRAHGNRGIFESYCELLGLTGKTAKHELRNLHWDLVRHWAQQKILPRQKRQCKLKEAEIFYQYPALVQQFLEDYEKIKNL